MSNVRIVIDPRTIIGRQAAPATGDIWIEIDEVVFPLQGWNDFVIVILEAWAGALVRILRRTSKCETIHFMEGPYMVRVQRPSRAVLHLRAIERYRGERERACVDTGAEDFVNVVLSCAEGALTECRRRSIWSTDEAKLDTLLPILRKEASKI
jgi:hypothetical protein